MYFYLKDAAKNIGHCQTNPVWRAHVLDIAEKSIHNTFLFTDKYEMERVADPVTMDPIDWNFVPGDDEEWCFALSRHTFLLNNAKAAVITRDKRYSENWVRLFEDFYHNTTLCKETEKRSWRSLECGIRIENYIRSLELLESVSMAPSKDVYDDIKAFFRTHIDYLLSAHTAFHRLSNWGVLQDHGLFLASLYIGDEDSMKIAADRLDEEIALQTLPDGMHWEQSSMYHGEVLHAVLDTILVAQRQGIKLPERLIANTHCLALGLARSLRCDGKCYLYGDSDEIDMRDLVAEAAVLFSDPVLSGYAEGGLDEEFYLSFELDTKLPEPEKEQTSFFFRESGNAFLRLGTDTALHFRSGFMGSGHGHLDNLHFDLYHKGVAILTDTGRYTYVDKSERYALKGAYGHNTIVLNSEEPALMKGSWDMERIPESAFSDAVIDGEFRFLRSSHTGYADKGLLITRSIITIGERYIILADDIRGGSCDADILFHFDENSVLSKDSNLLKVANKECRISIALPGNRDYELASYPLAKRYNELSQAPLLIRKEHVENRKLIITLISIGDEAFSFTSVPVRKSLTGTIIPEEIALGIVIEDKDARYSIGIVSNEYMNGGFLLTAGDAEAYGKVLIKKNNENTAVLKY